MDNNYAYQPPNTIDPVDNDSKNLKLNLVFIVVYIAFMIIAILSGIAVGNKTSSQTTAISSENSKNWEKTSTAITYEIFDNKMLSNWSGRVLGRVKSKTENSLTLTPVRQEFYQDGSSTYRDFNQSDEIIIYVLPVATQIIDPQKTSNPDVNTKKIITLKDISIGSIIEGSISFNLNKYSKQYDFIGETLSLRI